MRQLWTLCALVVALTASSCSDRGDCPVVPDGYALDRDGAVLGYRNGINARDVELLRRALHESFEFTLPQTDADSLGIGRVWDREEELAIAQRLFEGIEGVRVDTTCQPAPDPAIPLTLFLSEAPFGTPTEWEFVASGPYAGSWRREFGLNASLLDSNGLLDFIQGIQAVYVRDEPLFGNAERCGQIWRIVAWEDLGANSLKHGTFGWGRVKARWRTGGPEPRDCP